MASYHETLFSFNGRYLKVLDYDHDVRINEVHLFDNAYYKVVAIRKYATSQKFYKQASLAHVGNVPVSPIN